MFSSHDDRPDECKTMATAEPIRSGNQVSRDRSSSCSDDVVSLDSWSEKLDPSIDWPTESVSQTNRSRLSSGGSGISGLNHLASRRPPHDVKKEKSALLRSEPPDQIVSSGARGNQAAIPTISGNVQHLQGHSMSPARRTNSRDCDPALLYSPRSSYTEHPPQSPPHRVSGSGGLVSPSHHLQFAHHLHPSYLSSPVHRTQPGHASRRTLVPHSSHQSPGGSHPHHRGVPYYGQKYPHQINCHVGNNAAFDQIFEREGEKLKTKVKSIWNNMKYGWTIKTKTSFKYDSPIILLGRCYHRRADEDELQPQEMEPPYQQQYRVSALDEFHADFTSRLWFTYRREFAPIGSSKMTTDCGWGCMLRSGQMMIAQALVQHFLGRDWRVYSEQRPEDLAFYREIIRWFGDHPSDKMPFSLHRLVELGTSVGKMPGDWYGPASVAYIFRDAMDKGHISLPILSNICTYVAQDCTIFLDDLMNIMTSHPRSDSQRSTGSQSDSETWHLTDSQPPHHHHNHHHHQQQGQRRRSDSCSEEKFRSVIVLVPMRLGGETLNEIYIDCVKSMLAHDNCIGIIGGRPKHSLYFVGWQDDKLIYLDPHYCQDTVDTTQSLYPIQTYHCMSPRKMPFTKMDPSCTVGFYCRNRKELETFIQEVPDMVVPRGQRGHYPLFIVAKGTSSEHHSQDLPVRELGRLRIQHIRTDQAGNRVRSPTLDSEDFVIL